MPCLFAASLFFIVGLFTLLTKRLFYFEKCWLLMMGWDGDVRRVGAEALRRGVDIVDRSVEWSGLRDVTVWSK